jgi:ABC-type dipeptide/oligopeptide/nickel transport system ATPase component
MHEMTIADLAALHEFTDGLVRVLPLNVTIGLVGTLGAGKTTLTQSIAQVQLDRDFAEGQVIAQARPAGNAGNRGRTLSGSLHINTIVGGSVGDLRRVIDLRPPVLVHRRGCVSSAARIIRLSTPVETRSRIA